MQVHTAPVKTTNPYSDDESIDKKIKFLKSCFLTRLMYLVEIDMLEMQKNDEELFDRLTQYWTNVGIVGAFVASIAIGPYFEPPNFGENDHPAYVIQNVGNFFTTNNNTQQNMTITPVDDQINDDTNWKYQATGAIWVFSFLCALCSMGVSVLLITFLMTIPKSKTRLWVSHVIYVVPMPLWMLLTCVGWLFMGIIVQAYATFGFAFSLGLFFICGCGACFIFAIILYIKCASTGIKKVLDYNRLVEE